MPSFPKHDARENDLYGLPYGQTLERIFSSGLRSRTGRRSLRSCSKPSPFASLPSARPRDSPIS